MVVVYQTIDYIDKMGQRITSLHSHFDALENFAGVNTATSEKHKNLRSSSSTQSRDKRGLCPSWSMVTNTSATLWIRTKSPRCSKKWQSINCLKNDGKRFTDVTLRCNDKVTTISGRNEIVKVRSKNTEANSLLFKRIMLAINNSSDNCLLTSLLPSHLPCFMMVMAIAGSR